MLVRRTEQTGRMANRGAQRKPNRVLDFMSLSLFLYQTDRAEPRLLILLPKGGRCPKLHDIFSEYSLAMESNMAMAAKVPAMP